MPKRKLNARQAWALLARRLEERGCVGGLCFEIGELRQQGHITLETKMEMRAQLDYMFSPDGLGDYVWPSGEASERIIAATLLAEGVAV